MKRTYKQDQSFNDAKPSGGNKREIVKIEEHLEQLKFKNKYVGVRLVGPAFRQALHWVRIKPKDGKETGIPKMCFRYDAESDTFDTTKECPYCDKLHSEYSAKQRYFTNAIIRAIEEEAPKGFEKKYSKTEAKTGFKDGVDSKAWTPVRVLALPGGVAGKLKGLAELNKHKVKGKTKAMPLSDDQFGRDVEIKYDKDAKSAAQSYDVQRGDATELDEVQQNYLHWNIEAYLEASNASMMEDIKTAREEVKRLKVIKKKEGADEEYSEEGSDDGKKKKAGKSSKKGKSKKEESEEASDEKSESSDEASEESSDAKSSKKKPAAKKGKKKEDSDEGSDESSDEKSESSDESSDEGSDEKSESSDESSDEPSEKPKGKGKKPAAKKGKSKKEESDEGSDESSDEKSEESDFNLDESSDEGSEDSDKPAKGKGKKPAAKKGKSKKEESDEGSDEGSDESSDESSDEPSEKPAKKGKGKPAAKSSKKGKSKKEDSDESSF